jgi:hypothetical protein
VGGGAAGRPVFTLDGTTFSWADVVDAARRYGSWRELEETARQGLACEARLAAAGETIAPHELVASAERFRYAHHLLAGEELQHWLERWELTAPEWRDHLRRALLRERWAGELAETVRRFPVGDEELAPVLWPDAVCSGLLTRVAERLASDGALAVAAGETLGGEREPALARIQRAAERARAYAATEEAIQHEVALHRLEWIRIESTVLAVPELDTAREAALSIRDDGRSLADVAADCGTEPAPLRAYAADLDAELSAALLGAREGDLVGPVPRDGGFALLLVEAKAPPDAADPEVRRRAELRIAERAVGRALREHVEWHELL